MTYKLEAILKWSAHAIHFIAVTVLNTQYGNTSLQCPCFLHFVHRTLLTVPRVLGPPIFLCVDYALAFVFENNISRPRRISCNFHKNANFISILLWVGRSNEVGYCVGYLGCHLEETPVGIGSVWYVHKGKS